MADRFIQWEMRGIERMRGPLPDCDRCHGVGIVSVPLNDDTATMVLCECADALIDGGDDARS
jgi:hypothetical protein